MMSEETKSKWTKQATERVLAALNRADELGGEVRDFLQEKVAADPRYVGARKRLAKLLGKKFESRDEVTAKAQKAEAARKAVAAPTPPSSKERAAQVGFGNPDIKAQV